MSGPKERILIIKLGALGDFVQALGPMAAIKRHHAGAPITLLTTKPYVAFAKATGLFDEVWVDEDRPKAWQFGKVRRLRKLLKSGDFTRVYDLQTSDRSSFYYFILGPGPRPEWSGIARGCSHPHDNFHRDDMHTIDRQRDQLAQAGIKDVPLADLGFAAKEVGQFGLVKPYALLVPGGAPHRPEKRWAAERYAALASKLLGAGVTPVVLGGPAEGGIAALITHDAPGTQNLCGKTDFLDIAVLARGAALAVGNDTGPMHMITLAGAPSVVLYSYESNPKLCGQRGPHVTIVRRESLDDLGVEDVWAKVQAIAPEAFENA